MRQKEVRLATIENLIVSTKSIHSKIGAESEIQISNQFIAFQFKIYFDFDSPIPQLCNFRKAAALHERSNLT